MESVRHSSDVFATVMNPQQPGADEYEMTVSTAQKTETSSLNINDMPDEMLINILSHMSFNELINVTRKVCSRWDRLSQDTELWTDKQFEITYWSGYDVGNSKGDRTDQEAIQTLCSAPNLCKIRLHRGARSQVFRTLYTRCRQLTELHINSSQKLSYSVLKNLVEKCSKIHTLTISSELLKLEKYAEAVSQWQHLHVLYLQESPMENPPLLRPLGDGCPQLSEVDFMNVNVNMDDLRHFLDAKKTTLKCIRIRWTMVGKRCVLPLLTICADSLECLQLYEYNVVREEAEEAFTALGSLKNLRKLQTSIIEPPPPGTTPLAFKTGGLSKLKLLDLAHGFCLDNDAIIAICRGCPALCELNVRGAELLTDAAFSQIHRLKHLEKLDVSCCNGLGGALMPFLSRLPQLHTLCLEEMVLQKLEPGLSSILDLSCLRCLKLNYSTITGMPFDKFPGKLINLRELHIDWSRGDSTATDGLNEQMPDLQIYGSIQEEEPPDDTEDHEYNEDDAEEESNEEQAGPGDADAVHDDNDDLEGHENGEDNREEENNEDQAAPCDVNAVHDDNPGSESDSDEYFWGECVCDISFLFLEEVNK